MTIYVCHTCDARFPSVVCAECARRDLEGMREFQAKYIAADRARRQLVDEVRQLRADRDSLLGTLRTWGDDLRGRLGEVARLEAFRAWAETTGLTKAKIQRMARAMRGRG